MNKRIFVRFTAILLCVIASLCLFACSHTHTEKILPAIPPSCTEVGLTEGKECSVCGEVLVAQTVIEKLAHTEEIIEAKAPSCKATGLTEGKKCSSCGEIMQAQEIVERLSHTEEIIASRQPSCTQEGATEGKKCSTCGDILEAPQYLPPKHTEEIIPRVEPLLDKTGYTEGKKCTVCKEILTEPEEISLLSIEIEKDKSKKGQISGNLVFNSLSGEFSVYYADSQKERLSYFNSISLFTPSELDYSLELDSLIIPSECEYIVATNGGEYVYFAKVPREYSLGEKEYTYSSLSDVHGNGGESGRGHAFEGALDFLDKYGEIDLVAISGDISDGAERDLIWFNEAISNREYKVYTSMGNHDTNGTIELWKRYVNTSITTDDEVFDIGENGIDFVYIPKKSPDSVFVFLCQTV